MTISLFIEWCKKNVGMLTLTGRGNVQHALSVFGNTSANQQNHEEFI